MKRSIVIIAQVLLVSLCAFIAPREARSDGEVQYTKEMVLGKWYNITLPISKEGHMEIFIFNRNGTFEYEYYTQESKTEKKTLTRFTGSFKVENNTIHCLEEKTSNPQTDLFPPLWHIVAEDINVKLEQLQLKPDSCMCGESLFSKYFLRDRGAK